MSAAERLPLALALLALALALPLALRPSGEALRLLPLLGPHDPPGALQGPGEAERALQARAAAIGDYLTIEDLARGVLLLERGELPGVSPLSEAERQEVARLLAEADAHRGELLELEQQIAAADEALGELATRLAWSLSPEQRAALRSQRNRVSVGEVERAYWDELFQVLEAP